MKELTRAQSETIISMLNSPGSSSLAIDILLNINERIHHSQDQALMEAYTQHSGGKGLWRQLGAPGTWQEWERIRAKHWTPRWGNLGVIETEKHIHYMKDLKAKRGHKPPKKKGSVLVKVGNGFSRGQYIQENNSWLVDGQFVKPKEVTWYKEAKQPSKKGTGSVRDVKGTQ